MMPIASEYRPTAPRWREDVRAMRLAVWPGVLGLLALALAACFNLHAPSGVPCSANKSCPENQACVNNVCGGTVQDAPIDAMPDAFIDTDGDKIPDDMDNCPKVPNPDQGDEDLDGVGDLCDPCPIDKDNSDPDGDGVAGLCDPHPSTPGDKIVAFQGFHGPIPDNWKVVGTGTVAVTADYGVITNAANQVTALVAKDATPPFGNGMIMASVSVDATPGAARTALTVGLPYNSATDRGILCQLHAPTPGSTAGRELSLFDTLATAEPNMNQVVWQDMTAYRLAMVRNGGNYACSMTDLNAGTVKTANGADANIPAVSEVALIASGTTVHVAWVLVVSSP
jgi:hypothetical protein